MKTSIIFLGLVALSFTNANAATNFKSQDLNQQESATVYVDSTNEQNQLVLNSQEVIESTPNYTDADTLVFSPSSVVKSSYLKTMEDEVAENKQIIDSREEIYQPLSIGYTTTDRITENNQIIESNVSNEAAPLDFKKINRKVRPAVISSAIKAKSLKL